MKTNSGQNLAPLMRAAWEGDTVQAQALIEEGADVNARDDCGRTALMVAAERGHTYVVQVLLDCGADVMVRDDKGMTALKAAKSKGYARIVSLLKRSVTKEDSSERGSSEEDGGLTTYLALHRAVDDGDIPALNALIRKGADVDARSDDEWTPLMLATIKGHTRVVEALLKNGAEANARNKKGWTALMFAVSLSDVETINILLDGGANPNARDIEGKTALTQAVSEKNIESIRALMAKGVDVNLEDFSGETALAIALRRGYTEISDMLRQAGAKLKASQAASANPRPSLSPDATVDGEALFNEGELLRLKEELEGFLPNTWPTSDAAASDALTPEVQSLSHADGVAETQAIMPAQISEIGERLIRALEALRKAESAPAPRASLADIGHKLLLSVPEAAALSSLSRTHVRRAIKAGELRAKIIGRGWRIKRVDLNSYVEQL